MRERGGGGATSPQQRLADLNQSQCFCLVIIGPVAWSYTVALCIMGCVKPISGSAL
uniref:Uncharacterized protein n=1 Tax=Anguilla anguilla TaxID=7936 RepID=A0A0E9WHG0_ANGAN